MTALKKVVCKYCNGDGYHYVDVGQVFECIHCNTKGYVYA